MGVVERRAREKEALRQRILDAATELFVSEGFEQVSIRKIAERIEYAPSTIYLYFQDKSDLLSEICSSVFRQLCAIFAQIDQEEPEPLANLRRGMRAYIDFGLAHPQHYLLTFNVPPPRECREGASPAMREAYQSGLDCFDCLRRSVQRCTAAGLFRTHAVELIAQTSWMHIHGVTSQLIVMGDDPDFPWVPREELIQSVIDTTIKGFQA